VSDVAVLGASSDPSRYSFMAVELLLQKGHRVYPVHPRETEVLGQKCVKSLAELPTQKIHTLTMYVNPQLSEKLLRPIVDLGVKRVIFNPGTENPQLMQELTQQGIDVVEGCTLVMLRTGQF
jgi:predicted CoA-binding protein